MSIRKNLQEVRKENVIICIILVVILLSSTWINQFFEIQPDYNSRSIAVSTTEDIRVLRFQCDSPCMYQKVEKWKSTLRTFGSLFSSINSP